MEYPMRINKYLAQKQYASRREADKLIEQGLVLLNGKIAKLGDQVKENDKVEVNKKVQARVAAARVYLAFNKPLGVVTHSPQAGQKGILDVAKLAQEVFPLGRLDKDSSGLIILTNDGRITDRLLNPAFDHDKEYRVRVNKPLLQNSLTRLAKGIKLEDGKITKRADVDGETGGRTFYITLTEGKKHQIRRMVTALGYEVEALERVRILNIKLGDLKPGAYREIKGEEKKAFLKKLGFAE